MTNVGLIRYCLGILAASLLVHYCCEGVEQCVPMNVKAQVVLDSSIVQCYGGAGCSQFITGGGRNGSVFITKVDYICCFYLSIDTCYSSAQFDAFKKDFYPECYIDLNNIMWEQPTNFKVKNENDGITFTVSACSPTLTTTTSTQAITQVSSLPKMQTSNVVSTETVPQVSTTVSTQASSSAPTTTPASTGVEQCLPLNVKAQVVLDSNSIVQCHSGAGCSQFITGGRNGSVFITKVDYICCFYLSIDTCYSTAQYVAFKKDFYPECYVDLNNIKWEQPTHFKVKNENDGITFTVSACSPTLATTTSTQAITQVSTTVSTQASTSARTSTPASTDVITTRSSTIQPDTTIMTSAVSTTLPVTIATTSTAVSTNLPVTIATTSTAVPTNLPVTIATTLTAVPINLPVTIATTSTVVHSTVPVTIATAEKSTMSVPKTTPGMDVTTSASSSAAPVTTTTSQPEVTTSVERSTVSVSKTTTIAVTTDMVTSATSALSTMEVIGKVEIETNLDVFSEAGSQFFNTAEKVMEKLTKLFEALADAVKNLKINQVNTIDLPEAHIQYAHLPDISYWKSAVTEKPGDRVRLLELTPLPTNKPQKRSLNPVRLVYALFFFDLRKMLALHSLQPSPTSAMWWPTLHYQLFPSEEAPYLRIQIGDEGPIPAALKFQVNMTADDMFDTEIPRKMSRSSDEPMTRDYACLRRVDSPNGTFSPRDCSSVTTEAGMVTCSCNKTGFFTVSARVAMQMRAEAWDLLCLLISILGLILLFLTTIALVGMHGEVMNDRIVVQINLVLSLFLLHCVLFFERSSSKQKTPCVAVMFLTHFFMLVTACFALVESFTILSNLNTRALRWKRLNRCPLVVIQIFVGWVIPLVIAAVTISVHLPNDDYLAYQQFGTDRCWFEAGSDAIVATVTAPIATFFSICGVASFVTFGLSLHAKRSAPRGKNFARQYDVMKVDDVDMDHEHRMLLEHILACVSLLVPWTFYFIHGIGNMDTSLSMMYCSTGLISSQGVFVFVAYIIVSKDTRQILVGKVEYPGPFNLYWYGPQRKGETVPLKKSSRRLQKGGSYVRSKTRENAGLRSSKRSVHTNFGNR